MGSSRPGRSAGSRWRGVAAMRMLAIAKTLPPSRLTSFGKTKLFVMATFVLIVAWLT